VLLGRQQAAGLTTSAFLLLLCPEAELAEPVDKQQILHDEHQQYPQPDSTT